MKKEIKRLEELESKMLQAFICTQDIKKNGEEIIFQKDKVYLGSIRPTMIGLGGVYYKITCETGEVLKISNLGEGLLNRFYNLEDLERKKKWLQRLEKEGVSQLNLPKQDFTNVETYKVTIEDKKYDSYGIYTVTPEGNSCVYVPEKNIILEEYHMNNPSKKYWHKPKKEMYYILELIN
jgi:hypothetical protein